MTIGTSGSVGFEHPDGGPASGEVATVYLTGTNTLATLYTSIAGTTTTPNPTTIDGNGNLTLFAAVGVVDVEVNGARVAVLVHTNPVNVVAKVREAGLPLDRYDSLIVNKGAGAAAGEDWSAAVAQLVPDLLSATAARAEVVLPPQPVVIGRPVTFARDTHYRMQELVLHSQGHASQVVPVAKGAVTDSALIAAGYGLDPATQNALTFKDFAAVHLTGSWFLRGSDVSVYDATALHFQDVQRVTADRISEWRFQVDASRGDGVVNFLRSGWRIGHYAIQMPSQNGNLSDTNNPPLSASHLRSEEFISGQLGELVLVDYSLLDEANMIVGQKTGAKLPSLVGIYNTRDTGSSGIAYDGSGLAIDAARVDEGTYIVLQVRNPAAKNTLAVAANAGDSTITLTNKPGATPGNSFIVDIDKPWTGVRERRTALNVSASAPWVITLDTPLTYAHAISTVVIDASRRLRQVRLRNFAVNVQSGGNTTDRFRPIRLESVHQFVVEGMPMGLGNNWNKIFADLSDVVHARFEGVQPPPYPNVPSVPDTSNGATPHFTQVKADDLCGTVELAHSRYVDTTLASCRVIDRDREPTRWLPVADGGVAWPTGAADGDTRFNIATGKQETYYQGVSLDALGALVTAFDIDLNPAALSLSAGASVASITGQGLLGLAFTQGTGANQPTFQPTGGPTVSGSAIPTLVFAPTQYLQTAAFATAWAQPYVVQVAFRRNSTSGQQTLLDGLVNLARAEMLASTGSYRLNAGISLAGGAGDSAWNVATFIVDKTSSAIRVNGVQVALGNAGAATLDGLTVGANNSLTNPLNGSIARLRLKTGRFAAAGLTLLDRDFGAKTGIGVA